MLPRREKERIEPEDPMADEVDRLLRGLPSYAPKQGWKKPEPVKTPPPSSATPANKTRPVLPAAQPLRRRTEPPRSALERKQRLGVWLRVGLGVSVGLAMTQWPYEYACGFSLTGYLTGVTAVLATGVWSSLFAWKGRMGLAHIISLGVLAWGVTLGAKETLSRVGYAKAEATWTCSVPAPIPVPEPDVTREPPPR